VADLGLVVDVGGMNEAAPDAAARGAPSDPEPARRVVVPVEPHRVSPADHLDFEAIAEPVPDSARRLGTAENGNGRAVGVVHVRQARRSHRLR